MCLYKAYLAWGPYGGDYGDCSLMGYNAVYFGELDVSLPGRTVSWARHQQEEQRDLPLDMFQNVGLFLNLMVLQPRRPYSSLCIYVCERKWSPPNFRNYTSTLLEGLRKSTKAHSLENWCPGWDLKPWLPHTKLLERLFVECCFFAQFRNWYGINEITL
jgi:hypothetical protein